MKKLGRYERTLSQKIRRHYPLTDLESLALYAGDVYKFKDIIKIVFKMDDNNDEVIVKVLKYIVETKKIGICSICGEIIKGECQNKTTKSSWGVDKKSWDKKVCSRCNNEKVKCVNCRRDVLRRGMLYNYQRGKYTNYCNKCACKMISYQLRGGELNGFEEFEF